MPTYFSIVSELHGFVVDIVQSRLEAGAQLIMYPSHGGDNQLWYHNIATGVVHSKLSYDFVLDVIGGILVINRYDEMSSTQRFGLGPKHIYQLTDKYKVFDVAGVNKEEGTKILLHKFHGKPNQCWKYNNV